MAIEEVPAPQMITPVKEEKKVEKKTIVLADPWERSLAFIVDMMILNIMIFAMGYFAFYFSLFVLVLDNCISFAHLLDNSSDLVDHASHLVDHVSLS